MGARGGGAAARASRVARTAGRTARAARRNRLNRTAKVAEIAGGVAGLAALGLAVADAVKPDGGTADNSNPTRRRRGARGRGGGGATPDPYIQQIMMSANSSLPPPMYPDGSQLPSIPLKMKQRVIITPEAERIVLSLLPVYDGVLGIRSGTATYMVPSYAASPSSTVTAINSALYNGGGTVWSIVPFRQLMATADQATDEFSAAHPSSFRILSVEARFEFSGASLADQGSYSLCRGSSNYALAPSTATINGVTVPVYNVDHLPNTSDDQTTAAQYAAGAAKDSFTVLNVNSTPAFQPILPWVRLHAPDNATGVVGVSALTSGGANMYAGVHGWDPNVPWTTIVYDGVASTATITVDLTVQYEMTVSSGNILAAIARPNPPRRAKLENQLQNLASALPPVFQDRVSQFLGKQPGKLLNRMQNLITDL